MSLSITPDGNWLLSNHYLISIILQNSKLLPTPKIAYMKANQDKVILFEKKNLNKSNVINREWKELYKLLENNQTTYIDSQISYNDFKKIEDYYQTNKTTTIITEPHLQLDSETIKIAINIIHDLEMSFIYACSLIVEGVSVSEIINELYEYLIAKNYAEGIITPKINFIHKGKSIDRLKKTSLITFQIVLNYKGLQGNFNRSLVLGKPSPTLAKNYLNTKKILLKIIDLFKNNPELIDWSKHSEIINEKENLFYIRELSSNMEYQEIDFEHNLMIKKNDIYFLLLKNKKTDIIIGASLVVKSGKIELLEKYGFDFLKFPW